MHLSWQLVVLTFIIIKYLSNIYMYIYVYAYRYLYYAILKSCLHTNTKVRKMILHTRLYIYSHMCI